MTRLSKGGENPQMDDVATEQVGARLAWFLSGAYAGGAKRKRIARDFEVSPDTAKGWLNGTRPASRHFDTMVKKWGREFLRFVYPATADERDAELQQLKQIAAHLLTRIEGGADEALVGRSSQGLASSEGDQALQAGAGNGRGPCDRGAGGDAP